MPNLESVTAALESSPRDRLLLTPGPLTTSPTVKQAMLHDYGSRDQEFIELNAALLQRLVHLAQAEATHVAVPLQGSGTFVVEAMLGCFVPPSGKVLICINGAYGERIKKICDYHKRQYVVLQSAEDTPTDVEQLERILRTDAAITQVALVYVETTSGILNPLAAAAAVVERYGKGLLVDAMSSFGALPVDGLRFDALCASSNKCLQGVPGVGFCIARQSALLATAGHSPSLSLDLLAQWHTLQQTGQWRFTPPTHVLLALAQALNELQQEGGVAARAQRYRKNCQVLVDGMRAMGFKTLLADELQAPIIVTFRMPQHPRFVFQTFYDRLKAKGYVVYPGKLTVADTFRIGCIGHLDQADIRAALRAIQQTVESFDIALPLD